MHALVMEYIEGSAIDDKEKLLADGYDMGETCGNRTLGDSCF